MTMKAAKNVKKKPVKNDKAKVKSDKVAEPTIPASFSSHKEETIPVRVGDVVKTKSDGSFLSDMQGVIVGNPNNNEVTIRVIDCAGAYGYLGDRLYNTPLSTLELVERRTRILGV